MIIAHPVPVNFSRLVDAKNKFEDFASKFNGMTSHDERPPYPPQAPSPSTLPDPYLCFSRTIGPALARKIDQHFDSERNTQAQVGPSSLFSGAEGLPKVDLSKYHRRPSSPYVDTFRPFSPDEAECTTVYYTANSSFATASVYGSPAPSPKSFLDLASRAPTPDSPDSFAHDSCTGWTPLPSAALDLEFPYSSKVAAKIAPCKWHASPVPSLLDDDSGLSSPDESPFGTPASAAQTMSPLADAGELKGVKRVNPKPPMSYYTDPTGATAHFSYENALFVANYHIEMEKQRAMAYERRNGIPYVHWSAEADQGPIMSYLKKAMGLENDPAWALVP
ncbi:hypothetical protein SCHPADRAFT_946565 [Schizopora paradoxa]|uniref:Uncharacterized protein n=1 Tax=Schizopora paradoxa TaxID=27342 RepID=A0A0H2RLW5_9AGAM|nr:hypothetical protein SCHPADRAFT_946565 [Schizopora paradoxa]